MAIKAIDLNSSEYLGDLFSCSGIYDRTIKSQPHCEIDSAFSMPEVWFKMEMKVS
ncbi:MAG: hypothetical protein ACEY3J_04335 [Arsenophonus sp.]